MTFKPCKACDDEDSRDCRFDGRCAVQQAARTALLLFVEHARARGVVFYQVEPSSWRSPAAADMAKMIDSFVASQVKKP